MIHYYSNSCLLLDSWYSGVENFSLSTIQAMVRYISMLFGVLRRKRETSGMTLEEDRSGNDWNSEVTFKTCMAYGMWLCL
jgi:hypothetical protein